jgi:hypothetical protein
VPVGRCALLWTCGSEGFEEQALGHCAIQSHILEKEQLGTSTKGTVD